MNKKALLILFVMMLIGGISAESFEWGIRYMGGISSTFGKDDNHTLRYEIDDSGAHLAYLEAESQSATPAYAQGAGFYFMKRISKGKDSLWLQPELLWQRYGLRHEYDQAALDSDNLAVLAGFAPTLDGRIDHTVDFISVPLLVKLRQEIPEDRRDEQFQGAYIYFGPAYSYLLQQTRKSKSGVKQLDEDISAYVAANPGYSYETIESGMDKLVTHQFSTVIGTGFQIKDVFRLGLYKDTFSIDLRADMSMFTIGDAGQSKDFRLYSAMLSLGYRL